ncbi:MAG TPA: transposase [Spirochaetota bacterium]|nr:transposase [Spirochaetota bacterium]HPC42238.1 transposase [Spirochaetota bacterium]HQF08192.1 transposase [Spirochaetota bacterium]HQH97193.1 transposase [Spirochaetota bacterium]HQJ70103.1 transposase [Spirochaetota bacterium]
MPRQLRIQLPDATYHAVSRCIEIKPLMRSPKIKNLMIDVLNLALEKYNFQLIGYTIMDNHFHLYIKTVAEGENISRIMQFIKSQFTRRYNRMMNRTGPFWNERFKDVITELTPNPRETFFNTLLYLGYNPVRNGLVNDPRDYNYSSIKNYLDENYLSPVQVTLHEYFLELGNSFKDCVNRFLVYEEMYRKRIFHESLFL